MPRLNKPIDKETLLSTIESFLILEAETGVVNGPALN
jgi:hypothetical protein